MKTAAELIIALLFFGMGVVAGAGFVLEHTPRASRKTPLDAELLDAYQSFVASEYCVPRGKGPCETLSIAIVEAWARQRDWAEIRRPARPLGEN
jgi:hypothetical protein